MVTTQYAHLASMLVSAGDAVVRGDLISTVGDANGYYAGSAHLQVEFRWDESIAANQGGYGCPDETGGWAEPSVFVVGHRSVP